MDKGSTEDSETVEITSPQDLLIEAPRRIYKKATGPSSDLILRGLTVGPALKDNSRVLYSGKGITITVSEGETPEARRIHYVSSTHDIEVEFLNTSLISGSNKATRKFFNLLMAKVRAAVRGGKAIAGHVSFPLQELVDIEMYETIQSARAAFNNARDPLTSIKIKGTIRYGKKRVARQDTLGVIFYWTDIIDGQCMVYLAQQLDWRVLIERDTVLPGYYFGLESKAEVLCDYLFSLARQQENLKALNNKKVGYFTISLEAVRVKLGLPALGDTKNPQRDIIDKIDEALEGIEEAHRKKFNNQDLSLIIAYKDKTKGYEIEGLKARQLMEYCTLEVAIKGELLESINAVSGKAPTRLLKGPRQLPGGGTK